MGTRSLQASQKGIERAKIALAQYSLSQNALAQDLGLSRQTVNNFFKGKSIDRENFALICDRLGLDLENTVAISAVAASSVNQVDTSKLDALVQDVRQKVHANIHERCGTMRVLDMTRPIDLDTIYTDVNILQEIIGRQRLDLAELLKNCSLEEFDRLGFAHARIERRSGLEAVEEFDKLMLLGKPGAGKTTFLKRLATLCNTGTFQSHRVPIFVTLKDFGDSSEKPSLLTYIRQWLQELGIQESQYTEPILNQGRGFLLLDGLDEVSEKTSKQVLQEIQSFSNRFPQNAFVVSCRIAAKEFTFQQFTEVEVADFSDEQIADFANRWFQAKQLTEKTERFLDKLEGQPRIKELATNPLLLTLLCLVFGGRTDFPTNRSELYKEGLDVLLKKWDGTRSIEREQVYRELSLKRKEDLLSQLAFSTFESGNYFFKQKDAEHLIEAYIQNLPGTQADLEAIGLDSEAVLKSIEAQHGLLVERARGIYSFSHLTFHEYFAARELETRDELHQSLISHLTEKRWREVFLLTTGMLKNANSLLLLLKSQVDNLLITDENLQQFLKWVQQKASCIKAPYKAASIRAFYFALELGFICNLNSTELISIEHLIEEADFFIRQKIGPTLSIKIDTMTQVFILIRTFDLKFDFFTLSYALDFKLNHDFNLEHQTPLEFDRTNSGYDLKLDHRLTTILEMAKSGDHDLDLLLNLIQQFIVDDTLQQSFRKLREQLPISKKNKKSFSSWWQVNASAWLVQLRTLISENRNIAYPWQFNDIQKQKLQQYYNANKLMVDCLNSDCYLSREVRQEIEDSLLLPIAEIEERFTNQRIPH